MGFVVLVAVLILVQRCCGKVLVERSSKGDIDNLQSLADSEHRSIMADTEVQCLKLQDIQLSINAAGTVAAFSEKSRSDIAASGQDDSAAGGQISYE